MKHNDEINKELIDNLTKKVKHCEIENIELAFKLSVVALLSRKYEKVENLFKIIGEDLIKVFNDEIVNKVRGRE